MPLAFSVALPYLHEMPMPGSTLNEAPMSKTVTPVILGRVPEKPSYVTLQGRDRTIVELPLAQAAPEPDVALEILPIVAPMTFAMVAELKLPSRVTGHLASASIPPSPKKRSGLRLL